MITIASGKKYQGTVQEQISYYIHDLYLFLLFPFPPKGVNAQHSLRALSASRTSTVSMAMDMPGFIP